MFTRPIELIQVPNRRLFGVKAAACYLGVCEDTLRDYADKGMIHPKDLNGRRVFKLEELDAFIDDLPPYTSYPYTDRGRKPGGKEKRNGS